MEGRMVLGKAYGVASGPPSGHPALSLCLLILPCLACWACKCALVDTGYTRREKEKRKKKRKRKRKGEGEEEERRREKKRGRSSRE